MSVTFVIASVVLLLTVSPIPAQELEGFTLTGEAWTYDPGDGGPIITGILTTPGAGTAFPAVLINHGKGGSATSFSLKKAREFGGWGMVCIGPNYTHAGSGSTPDQEGYSPENSRRARACLTILKSMTHVNTNRLGVYGNSMGAFLTAGLCGESNAPFRAAAITAGGTSGTSNTNLASPAMQEAQGITAPFLMMHGTADTTVLPQQSETLQTILNSNSIPNSRVLFDGVGHDLHQARSNEVYALIRDWFTEWGVLVATNPPHPSIPRGIYVLDSPASTTNINGIAMRDANIRTNDFVKGYALRVAWNVLEPSPGAYDFTILDWNVRRLLAVNKKLSLLFMNTDPAWLAETAGVTTWYDSSIGRTRAVPWDAYLLARMEAVLLALASHAVDGVPLGEHPVLEVANFGLVGAKLAIRDPDAMRLKDMPGYSRSTLTDAVLRNLRAATSNFPNAHVQIGFWPINDDQVSPPLWDTLRLAILDEFDGVDRPRIGFWMENLAANRPAVGQDPITGRPVTSFGAPLYNSQGETWANFQALTPWIAPFPQHVSAVSNSTAADGISYAFSTYGSTYVELYVQDIDAVSYQDELREWSRRLTPNEVHLQLMSMTSNNLVLEWNRAAPVTQIDETQSLASPFNNYTTVTNRLNAVIPLGHESLTQRFFRVRQAR